MQSNVVLAAIAKLPTVNGNWQEILDDSTRALFTVGVVADLLGIDVQIVRRYDSEGFVTPHRSSGHQRRYSRDDIARLARAVLLAEQGIPMIGIRRIIELEDRLDGEH